MIIGIDGNEANVKNRVGSGIYAFELLKQFAKYKNYRFKIFLKDNPLPDLPIKSRDFTYSVFGPKKLWTRIGLPLKLVFGEKIDVFFTMGHYSPHLTNIPLAVTIFDLSYLHYPQLLKKNDLYQLTNWSKYSILKSKHIFTISKATKDDLVKNYKINPSKITVTYPGYDKERFKPQSVNKIEPIKRKYKIRGNYIIFIGTLQPRKNIERLIEAFAQLTQYSSLITQNYQLVIVGKKGWLYDSIFERVKNLKLEDKIIFTNYVTDSDLPALISGAKAFVLPSLWEGFGIPVVEAQACGVPVVVSNVSSLPEIVGESGILVDPQNAESIVQGVKKILTNDKINSDFVKKGFENIKRFSWQSCAQQTLQTLEKLASRRNP